MSESPDDLGLNEAARNWEDWELQWKTCPSCNQMFFGGEQRTDCKVCHLAGPRFSETLNRPPSPNCDELQTLRAELTAAKEEVAQWKELVMGHKSANDLLSQKVMAQKERADRAEAEKRAVYAEKIASDALLTDYRERADRAEKARDEETERANEAEEILRTIAINVSGMDPSDSEDASPESVGEDACGHIDYLRASLAEKDAALRQIADLRDSRGRILYEGACSQIASGALSPIAGTGYLSPDEAAKLRAELEQTRQQRNGMTEMSKYNQVLIELGKARERVAELEARLQPDHIRFGLKLEGGCCMECHAWTPIGHPEAHNHEDDCPYVLRVTGQQNNEKKVGE